MVSSSGNTYIRLDNYCYCLPLGNLTDVIYQDKCQLVISLVHVRVHCLSLQIDERVPPAVFAGFAMGDLAILIE